MTQKTVIPDRTALIPFVIFAIIAGVVTYCIWKGTRSGVVQMKEDTLYIKPKAKI